MSQPAVIDASVALKWRLDDEDHVAEAVALRDDFLRQRSITLLAPSLLLYEVANGLVMAARRGRLPAQEVVEALRDMLALGVDMATPDPVGLCQMSLTHDVTAYDGAYLALADALGCDLWTGDRQLYNGVRQSLPWVRWIGDYKS